MIKYTLIPLSILILSSPAHASSFTDGSFETQGSASMPNGSGVYSCYFSNSTSSGSTCASGAWYEAVPQVSNQGYVADTGIASNQISGYATYPTPEGNFYAFVRGVGSLSQDFTVSNSGTYNLTWLVASSTANGGSNTDYFSYEIMIIDGNGNSYSSDLLNASTYENWQSSSFQNISLLSGQTYTMSVAGYSTATYADPVPTAFFDNFQLTQQVTPTSVVPEPATWTMFLNGMMLVGFFLRRRKSSNGFTLKKMI